MEFEQIIKHLDWLDDEHRKDKEVIEVLSQRANSLEADLKTATMKIKDLSSQASQFTSTHARVEQFESSLDSLRLELVKYVNEQEAKREIQFKDSEVNLQKQVDGLAKSITRFGKTREAITDISHEVKLLADETSRNNKTASEWTLRFDTVTRKLEDVQAVLKATEESRRQDAKRFADLQGDLSAARKKLEDARQKNDLVNDQIRRIETRLNEVLANEAERRQAQTRVLETHARAQIERDRIWKEWEQQFASLSNMTETMSRNQQSWDASQRLLKRAQESYDEIIQKFERRITEITEMQRLAEDRFRQEWVTFKADDQKRWTSFTLSQGENQKDTQANLSRLESKLIDLQESNHIQQDIWQQTRDANEQLFQGMVAQLHELLSSYQRISDLK